MHSPLYNPLLIHAPLQSFMNACTTAVLFKCMHHCDYIIKDAPLWVFNNVCTTFFHYWYLHHSDPVLMHARTWSSVNACTTVLLYQPCTRRYALLWYSVNVCTTFCPLYMHSPMDPLSMHAPLCSYKYEFDTSIIYQCMHHCCPL